MDTKELFSEKTLDGQLYEIYVAAQAGGGGGGGAPTTASYVAISNNPTLTNERVLTQGSNITITDGGANNPVTVATVVDPTFDSVQIDTTPTTPVTPAVGKINWNDTDGTIEFGLKGGNVNLQVGQDNVILVKNDEASPLTAGEVVYISGANGVNLLVKRAQADADATSASTIGIVSEAIAVNGQGFITTFGVVNNVNTNAFNDGDILYLSPTTAGAATNVKPSAPDHLVLVGFVKKKSGGAGEIFVEIQNGYELEELHNVQINSGTLANNNLLAYNSATQTWQNKTASGAGLVGGSVGAVDNSVLRADVGTGIVQNSGLIIDDAIVSFAVTGDAATDIITATGSAFSNGQPVRFTALSGGSGLNTTTNYYVINVSGATFQVSTSIGGAASLFTSNIVAGTLLTGHSISTNVAISENTTETNSDLVLTPKGTGALIAGQKPNGATSGGNARGNYAVDFQSQRTSASQVASGTSSVICGGQNNTASAIYSGVVAGTSNSVAGNQSGIVCGDFNSITGTVNGDMSIICGGANNSLSSRGGFIGAGKSNSVTGNCAVVVGGGERSTIVGNTASGSAAGILSGRSAVADRFCMQSHAAGFFAAQGDAQRERFVLRCKTTTNSAVEMALDGGTTYLSIPSGKVIAMTVNISGVKSDGSAVAHYIRQYAVKNVGGTSSEVYAPVTIGTDNAAGTTIALSTNNADDTIRIAVTGIAAETWRWVASVDAVEIAYGT